MQMLRQKLLKNLCISIVSLFILNEIASFFDWYDLLWWFDMPMHFLGGLSVFYLSAVVWIPALKIVPPWRFLFESIITGILLGVLWEALELYLYTHYGSPNFIPLDSFSDLAFDTAGIMLGAYMAVPLAELQV